MKPILERSYELARSGECECVGQIRERLKAEGYGGEIALQLGGTRLKRDLRRLCLTATEGQKRSQIA